jgi:hypothetical protein
MGGWLESLPLLWLLSRFVIEKGMLSFKRGFWKKLGEKISQP